MFVLADTQKVYATVVDKADHLYRRDGGKYSDADFEANPDQYSSIFPDQVILLTLGAHAQRGLL